LRTGRRSTWKPSGAASSGAGANGRSRKETPSADEVMKLMDPTSMSAAAPFIPDSYPRASVVNPPKRVTGLRTVR
jgi:hypothetical protein